jgi:hypothetical protein
MNDEKPVAVPIPIGTRRFAVAKPGHEKSKAAVLEENQKLRGKLINMQQLLAAMLLEREDFTDQPCAFTFGDLECIDPRMVEVTFADDMAVLSLKEIESTNSETDDTA